MTATHLSPAMGRAKVLSTDDYAYSSTLTINHTQVSGGSDLLDFPLLVSLTDTQLKGTGSGGQMTSAAGYDLIFTESTGTVQLDHEIEVYDPSSGAIVMWVRVPVLSASVDTVITLYAGNAAVTTSRENQPGVWRNAGYQGVWHFPDGSTLTAGDSLGTTAAGTLHGATATSGKIDGGANFVGASQQYIDFGNATLNALPQMTISFWLYLSSSPSSLYYLVSKQAGLGYTRNFVISLDSTRKVQFRITNGSTTQALITASSAVPLTTWCLVTATVDGSQLHLYLNGASIATPLTYGFTPTTVAHPLWMGGGYTDAATTRLDGILDEVHIANQAFPLAWIATEYANQNAPATFITHVTRQNRPGTGRVRLVGGSTRPGLGRVNLGAARLVSGMGRAKVWATRARTSLGRMALGLARGRSTTGRTLLGIRSGRSALGRVRALGSRMRQAAGRARVTLQLAAQRSDRGRVLLSVRLARTASGRILLGLAAVRRAMGRARLSLQSTRQPAARSKIARSSTQNAAGRALLGYLHTSVATGRARFRGRRLGQGFGRARVILQQSSTRAGMGRLRASRILTRALVGRGRLALLTARKSTGRASLSLTARRDGTGHARLARLSRTGTVGRARLSLLHRSQVQGRIKVRTLIAPITYWSLGRLSVIEQGSAITVTGSRGTITVAAARSTITATASRGAIRAEGG